MNNNMNENTKALENVEVTETTMENVETVENRHAMNDDILVHNRNVIDTLLNKIITAWREINGENSLLPTIATNKSISNHIFDIEEFDSITAGMCNIDQIYHLTPTINMGSLVMYLLNTLPNGSISKIEDCDISYLMKRIKYEIKYTQIRCDVLEEYINSIKGLTCKIDDDIIYNCLDKFNVHRGRIPLLYGILKNIPKEIIEEYEKSDPNKQALICCNILYNRYLNEIASDRIVSLIINRCKFTADEFVEYLMFINDTPYWRRVMRNLGLYAIFETCLNRLGYIDIPEEIIDNYNT